MKPDTWNLIELFSKDVRYCVPLFQRPYVWNQENHWKPLWDDVTDVIDSYFKDSKGTVPHFLGAVVLKETNSDVLYSLEIIDGQQRLITLQIMITACRDVAQNKGFDRQARIFGKMTLNDEDVIANFPENYQLKVWPTNIDREAFMAVIQSKDTGPYKKLLITRAYHFFYEQISKWLNESDNQEEALDTLQTVLRSLFNIVVIKLGENDNPQVIFETLNARGTPLRASDLIKNLLFQVANDRGEDVDFLYKEYWQYFEDSNWKREIRQGRFNRYRLDLFLSHYLVMCEEKAIGPSALFEGFKTFLRRWPATIEKLLQDLQKYARIYDRFDSYPTTDPRGLFFYRLRTMNVVAAEPLLLYLFGTVEDEECDPDSLINILSMVESYLLRRLVKKLATERYTSVFIALLQKVKNHTKEAEANIRVHLTNLEGHYYLWPDDKIFRSALQSEKLYQILTQSRVRMILEAIEQYLRVDKFTEQILLLEKLTIEHLMPQKWETNWPLPSDDRHYLEKKEERNNRIHLLGNLTLINNKLNANLSNADWETKYSAITEHSMLALNNMLPEKWNEESIDKRGELLANIAIEIWPGPSQNAFEGLRENENSVIEVILAESITIEDVMIGRVRISSESSALLPDEKREIKVVLRGSEMVSRWEPPLYPDDEGYLTLDRMIMGNLVEVNEVLYLLRDTEQLFID